MSIIITLLGWVVSNPLMILGAIVIWIATGWISDVKGYFQQRDLAYNWAAKVQERDTASEIKDGLIEEALNAKDRSNAEIQVLRGQLDEAEINRKVAGVPDCTWSDSDIRLLNAAKRRR
jgi:hypothetical protein